MIGRCSSFSGVATTMANYFYNRDPLQFVRQARVGTIPPGERPKGSAVPRGTKQTCNITQWTPGRSPRFINRNIDGAQDLRCA